MIDEISTFIMDNWNLWTLSLPHPRYLRFLKTTSSLTTRSNINLFVFWEDNPKPSLLLRIPRDSDSTERLFEQVAKLQKVKSFLNEDLISHLPVDFGIYEVNKIHFSISLIMDMPLMTSLSKNPEQIRNNFRTSLEWLLAFHASTTSAFSPFSLEIINSTILKLIEKGRSYREFSSIENTFIQNIIEKANSSIGLNVPLGWIHGDFWPRNILLNNDSFIVIDWEHCKDNALPFLDIFIFCLGYGLSIQTPGDNKIIESFRKAFFSPGTISKLSEAFLREYMERRGINPIFGEIYFPISILELEVRQMGHEKSLGNNVSSFERFSYLAKHYSEKLINLSPLN